MNIVLSLFPGIGLLDMAFEAEGFCIVRGPDHIWGGDIRKFHPPAGKFDGIIGGPPCQAFSSLAHMVRHNGHEPKFGNLIPEFERCVSEAKPQWFIMEEVPAAPVPVVEGYGVHSFILNNRQCIDEDGRPAKQMRSRRWSFGWRGGRRVLMLDVALFENPEFEYAACGGHHGGSRLANENNSDEEWARKARARKAGAQIAEHERMKAHHGQNIKSQSAFRTLCELQGLPDDFDIEPFTVTAKCKAVGNGVPLPMGRTIARGIKEIIEMENA